MKIIAKYVCYLGRESKVTLYKVEVDLYVCSEHRYEKVGRQDESKVEIK